MMHLIKFIGIGYLLSFFFPLLEAAHQDRRSAFPYVSGDTFRASCDFIFDETNASFDPAKVQEGDIIFVKTDYLDRFFPTIHPQIASPYVLVTHNSDAPAPGDFARYLDEDKLLAWFAQSTDAPPHPKLHPIPIGIANRYWSHGNVDTVKCMEKLAPSMPKRFTLYMNFSPEHPEERMFVYNLFHNKPFCKEAWHLNFITYLYQLTLSKFVLSPRGNSLDCHRTWETLLMRAIPVVKHSYLDPLYEGLPVLIVNEWTDVTEELLEKAWEEMSKKEYQREKLYAPYWINLMHSYKKNR